MFFVSRYVSMTVSRFIAKQGYRFTPDINTACIYTFGPDHVSFHAK